MEKCQVLTNKSFEKLQKYWFKIQIYYAITFLLSYFIVDVQYNCNILICFTDWSLMNVTNQNTKASLCDHFVHLLHQGWPTFLVSVPNFKFISLGGPKISLKKTWRAKKGIFYNICMRKSPKFKVKILNKSLPGHSKCLGGPKMARGPRVGRPCSTWIDYFIKIYFPYGIDNLIIDYIKCLPLFC